DMSYTVKNLAEAGTFYFKVRATYIDGTQSRWSKSQKVTLFANGPEYELGDVNGDGEVDVRDITALIDVIMNDGVNPRADVNEDGEIDVRDISALIDIIMNS
ncbi:MAG: dockerin type I repeat-containing protein, partial [Muribaculaceae bacterium]|nr:dockerin type I repeat-containing protein [Muribaculaceae bacterium]